MTGVLGLVLRSGCVIGASRSTEGPPDGAFVLVHCVGNLGGVRGNEMRTLIMWST